MIRVLCLLCLVCFLAGCSSKDKIEIPKDTKPGPTQNALIMGGGGAGESPAKK